MVRGLLIAGALFVVLAASATAGADEPLGDATAEETRAHHRRGLELYDEGDYRLALVEFERAYEISHNFKILYNIGQVHYQLTRYARARRAFEQYLATGADGIPAKRREDVEKDLESLKGRTATLTIHANVPDAEIVIEGETFGKAPLERALVDAGTLHVQVSRPGYATRLREIALTGGDVQSVTVDLVETAAPPLAIAPPASGLSGATVAAWIGSGALAAGAIGTGIAASAAASTYDNKRNTPIAGSPEEARSDLERQRHLVGALAATTDVLAGLALVGVGVSIYLTFHDRPKPDAPRVRVQGTSATFSIGF